MSNCTTCGAPNPPGAAFCAHCGGRVQAAAPPQGSFGAPAAGSHFLGTPMRICPGCGVIAPTQRTTCAVCNTHYGATPPMVPPMQEGRYWGVILEADFACRGCGLRSPLDGLDLKGEATCRRCNLHQAFDADQWGEGLALAQNVADLAGPPGRRQPWDGNPFLAVGVSETWDEAKSEGMIIDADGMKPRTLRVRAAPGHPLCNQCKAPLDIALDGQGRAQTTCPRCRDQAVYALPDDYDDQNIDLLAVISDEHRVDRQMPRGTGIAFKPIWCLFEDEGPLRSGVADDDDDDDDDAHHHHHDHDDRMERVRAAQAAQAAQQAAPHLATPAQRKADGSTAVIGSIAVAVGVLAVVGVVLAIMFRNKGSSPPPDQDSQQEQGETKKSKKKKATDEEEPEPDTKSGKKGPGPPGANLDYFKPLNGCSCKVGSDTMQLRVFFSSQNKMKGTDADQLKLAWTIDIPNVVALQLEGPGGESPPRVVNGRGLAVGVACTKDTFVVVANDYASGWSTKTLRPQWDAKLTAKYAPVAAPSKDGINIVCNAVPLMGKSLKVPLVGGKSQAVDVTTGK